MRGRSIGTATLPTSTSVPTQRGEWGLQTGLRHGDLAHRCSRGIPAWRRGLLDDLRHGELAHKYFRGILAWRRRLLDDLRHGDLVHRYIRGILAWRRGLLTGLRHGDLAHRYSRGIQAWRDRHQSHVAPTRDIHRAGSPCLQTSQRQISLLGEANWTSPSKRLCPTPTLKGISRLDRQDK